MKKSHKRFRLFMGGLFVLATFLLLSPLAVRPATTTANPYDMGNGPVAITIDDANSIGVPSGTGETESLLLFVNGTQVPVAFDQSNNLINGYNFYQTEISHIGIVDWTGVYNSSNPPSTDLITTSYNIYEDSTFTQISDTLQVIVSRFTESGSNNDTMVHVIFKSDSGPDNSEATRPTAINGAINILEYNYPDGSFQFVSLIAGTPSDLSVGFRSDSTNVVPEPAPCSSWVQG